MLVEESVLTEERCTGCGTRLYGWELEDFGECEDGRYYCMVCVINRRCGCHSSHG